jgi:hypothetical protein
VPKVRLRLIHVWRLSVHRAKIKVNVSLFNTSLACRVYDPDNIIQIYIGMTPTSRSLTRPSCLRTSHPFGFLLLPITLDQRPFGPGTMHQMLTTEKM